MKLYKMVAVVAALTLALFAFGCELEDDLTDVITGGGADVVEPQGCEATEDYDLEGDDFCDHTLYYDIDCAGLEETAFDFFCEKSECDYNVGICEAMQPCGVLWTIDTVVTAKPCPNDPDCQPDLDACVPPVPCQTGSATDTRLEAVHCDSWCPLNGDGISVDADCLVEENAEPGKYCAETAPFARSCE